MRIVPIVSHREVEKMFVLLTYVQVSFEIKRTFFTEFQPYPEVDILDIRNVTVQHHPQN